MCLRWDSEAHSVALHRPFPDRLFGIRRVVSVPKHSWEPLPWVEYASNEKYRFSCIAKINVIYSHPALRAVIRLWVSRTQSFRSETRFWSWLRAKPLLAQENFESV